MLHGNEVVAPGEGEFDRFKLHTCVQWTTQLIYLAIKFLFSMFLKDNKNSFPVYVPHMNNVDILMKQQDRFHILPLLPRLI